MNKLFIKNYNKNYDYILFTNLECENMFYFCEV